MDRWGWEHPGLGQGWHQRPNDHVVGDPTLDRPDTLTLTSGVYKRHLRNGASVQFNAAGQQTATINALGYTTTFAYSGSNLATITLPVPAGEPVPVTANPLQLQ